jgi:hypothetical protein
MISPDPSEATNQPKMRSGADDRGQIKTRDRVRELAEVYTHEREVNAMLDLVPDMFPSTAVGCDLKFLEPACGSGNFLEAILRRKLRHIRFSRIHSVAAYEYRILRAVASIYGVDICTENVGEARERMLAGVRAHYYDDANTVEPTEGFLSALRAIVATNIVRADFLTEAGSTEVIDYRPVGSGHFKRIWSMLDDSAVAQTQTDLFDRVPKPKVDEEPVHYLELAMNREPKRGVSSARIARRGA